MPTALPQIGNIGKTKRCRAHVISRVPCAVFTECYYENDWELDILFGIFRTCSQNASLPGRKKSGFANARTTVPPSNNPAAAGTNETDPGGLRLEDVSS